MANSREKLFQALRAAQSAPPPLPTISGFGIRYDDPLGQFARVVADVGGRCVRVAPGRSLEEELARLPEYVAARRVVSLVPGVLKANVDLQQVDDAHSLQDLDFCVVPGELGVAENGAVWVTQRGPHRAAWFLAQHLALTLPAGSIVHNLHEAYERISPGAKGFGMFISGPSKTADIEQALVIGAQGPRSCTVLLQG